MRHRSRFLLLAIAVVLAALLLAACGGGGNGDDGGGNEETTEVPSDDNGSEDTSSEADALRELAGAYGLKEVKITYRLTSSGAAESLNGDMTLYWKPDVGWRVDFTIATVDSIFITTEDGTYSCTSVAGQGQCFESEADLDAPVPFLNLFTDPDELTSFLDDAISGLNVRRSSATIAGRDADCFSLEGEIEGESGSAEYCFADGLILRLSVGGEGDDGAGSFSFEAIEIGDSVSDSDFEPPFEIIAFDDILEDFDLEDFDLDDLNLDDILGGDE
ncbi:MAG: hypothetical protein IIC89_02650 [Chloroflexi bacterium]|nr:hypothetical protein [Chloroflexota bacterium]